MRLGKGADVRARKRNVQDDNGQYCKHTFCDHFPSDLLNIPISKCVKPTLEVNLGSNLALSTYKLDSSNLLSTSDRRRSFIKCNFVMFLVSRQKYLFTLI